MSVKKQSPAQSYSGKDSRISFGFGHLHDVSYTDCKQPTFFIDFLQRLKKICCVDWNTVNTSQRHAFGWEKISIGSIKRKKLNLTRDVGFLMAFRATGDNHVFLGFREGNVFQVVFVESSFGDIYNH